MDGGYTMSYITASVRFSGTKPIRLMASTASDFSNPIFGEYAVGDINAGWVRLTVTGLAPNTLYFVRPDFVGANAALLPVGNARTPPTGAHSFSFAAGSCWNPARNPVLPNSKFLFVSLLAKAESGELAFFFHLGDIHYADVQVENLSAHRNALEPVFRDPASPPGSGRRNLLMRSMPVYYMYDDHDAGGPDNGDGFDPGTRGGIEFFRKAAPNPPYAQSAITKPPYYSFKRGRVRFVVTDVRNDRSPVNQMPPESRRAMSAEQTTWFYDQLLAANTAGEPVIWVNTKPWIETASGNGWGSYVTQRNEIVSFITTNGMTNKIAILSGDMHALAYDNGTNAPAGLRVMHCAPLDQTISTKGGPYSHGPFTGSETQYGQIDVTDSGSGAVSVRFRGFQCAAASETAVIDQTFLLG